MARGAEAKLRRRNRKKEGESGVIDMFGQGDGDDFEGTMEETDSIPLPPGMQAAARAAKGNVQQPQADDDDDGEDKPILPKKKNKKVASSKDDAAIQEKLSSSSSGGIKRTPLILLILITGTTLLPAFIYAGDYVSAFLAKSNVMGGLAARLGIGAVPRKRVLSFYEKHAPEKISEVDKILAKYYGDYPKLIKSLERKYHDYGYFIGWEEDERPMKLAMQKMKETYDAWLVIWNRYAPQILKNGARNFKYNVTFLYKRGARLWKKHLWPLLEPFFGVPKGTDKQKRQDASEARKRRASGTRRRNADYRDEEPQE